MKKIVSILHTHPTSLTSLQGGVWLSCLSLSHDQAQIHLHIAQCGKLALIPHHLCTFSIVFSCFVAPFLLFYKKACFLTSMHRESKTYFRICQICNYLSLLVTHPNKMIYSTYVAFIFSDETDKTYNQAIASSDMWRKRFTRQVKIF